MADKTDFRRSIVTFLFLFIILLSCFHGLDTLEELYSLVLQNASRPTIDAVERIMTNRNLLSPLHGYSYSSSFNLQEIFPDSAVTIIPQNGRSQYGCKLYCDDKLHHPPRRSVTGDLPEFGGGNNGGDPILVVTVITIPSTILYTVILNPSKMIGGFTTAGRFRFGLYTTFIVMTFVSLILGFFALFFSGKPAAETRGPVWMTEDSLAPASVASLLLAMAVGLCAVLPKLGAIVVGVVSTLAAYLAAAAAAGLDFGANGGGPIVGPT